MTTEKSYTISYGKAHVPLYRVYATPLTGITAIPESAFTGRKNTIFAAEIDVEVFGENFLPAYTQGDNSNVVATDSMKNFLLRHALTYEGATLEGFLALLGRQFLTRYPHMERLRITGREFPFVAAQVPQRDGAGFQDSNVLFKRSHDDFGVASMDFARHEGEVIVSAHRSGRAELQLLKVIGSSFTRFVHDDYTTLPERVDRPLFIYLDVYWQYQDIPAMQERYIPSEQVRDVVQAVFHEFVSESIQQLVYEMGQRLLERFPQMSSVSFDAQNRTKDPFVVSETQPQIKVYSDPFPAYGSIRLTVNREA